MIEKGLSFSELDVDHNQCHPPDPRRLFAPRYLWHRLARYDGQT